MKKPITSGPAEIVTVENLRLGLRQIIGGSDLTLEEIVGGINKRAEEHYNPTPTPLEDSEKEDWLNFMLCNPTIPPPPERAQEMLKFIFDKWNVLQSVVNGLLGRGPGFIKNNRRVPPGKQPYPLMDEEEDDPQPALNLLDKMTPQDNKINTLADDYVQKVFTHTPASQWSTKVMVRDAFRAGYRERLKSPFAKDSFSEFWTFTKLCQQQTNNANLTFGQIWHEWTSDGDND